MKKVFIHSAVSISAQDTFDTDGFLDGITCPSGKIIAAQLPNYKDYITPAASRRMANGVKMGVTTATKALSDASCTQPDAIITGTGMGCLEDTEKFLNAIITNDEEFLTPTAFIQSTHNTVGAQIALALKCKSYNNTYTHAALSFESALLDAQLLLQHEEAQQVLVGGIDELGTEMITHVRMMEDADSSGIKIPFGEGASFFVVSSKPKENAVQIVDLEVCNTASKTQIKELLMQFLNKNAIKLSEIDALMLGRNGDAFDSYYDTVSDLLNTSSQLHYKHLCGEFYTASAFGLWAAHEILKRQEVPKALIYKGNPKPEINTILLYNQFKGQDHSFILLKR